MPLDIQDIQDIQDILDILDILVILHVLHVLDSPWEQLSVGGRHAPEIKRAIKKDRQ
jgi:hypothetical protein